MWLKSIILVLLTLKCLMVSTFDMSWLPSGLTLTILHNNDIHGRFEQTARNGGTCQTSKEYQCVGGFARTAEIIRKFRREADEGKSPPVLFLNAGDTFTGTSWFSVFTTNISAAFMNVLKPDAVALGNHEFDLTPAVLAKYVNAVDAPFVAANLDLRNEPSLLKIQKSVILQVRGGYKVGVVGYLTPETTKASSPGKVVILDEVREVRKEAKRLVNEGVNIIIALGHSGYEVDKKIAREVKEVDIVIGGHTNTFLWNGKEPDSETKEDVYPKIITQTWGKKVPVVQAYAYTKYLGVLRVSFDIDGNLKHASGQPIFLRNSIAQQKDVLGLLEVYKPTIAKLSQEKVGVSRVVLDGHSDACRYKECNFGNFITDVHVAYIASLTIERWTTAPIGIYNAGGIRNTIKPHDYDYSVSRGDLLEALPFGNQVITLTLSGSNLLYALEQMVRSEGDTSKGEFPQVSGIHMQVDMSKPPYSRVDSVLVRCGSCQIPVYETLKRGQNYTVVTSSFLSNGGDGITIFRDRGIMKTTQDLGDIELMVWYFNKYSPVYPEVHGRMEISGVRRTNNWTTMLLGIATLQILWSCI